MEEVMVDEQAFEAQLVQRSSVFLWGENDGLLRWDISVSSESMSSFLIDATQEPADQRLAF